MSEDKLELRPKPWRIVAGSGRWVIEDSAGAKVVETVFRSAADEIVQAVNERAGLRDEIVRLKTPCRRCRGTRHTPGYFGILCDECGGTGVAT